MATPQGSPKLNSILIDSRELMRSLGRPATSTPACPVGFFKMWQELYEKLVPCKITDLIDIEALANERRYFNRRQSRVLKRKANPVEKHQRRKIAKDQVVTENRIEHENLSMSRG